jgi:hypothetical protein
MRYFRDGVAHDPARDTEVRYFNDEKGLFLEYRINEADIVNDPPVAPGYPTKWYRSPKTGKKFHYVVSFYINVLYHAAYQMLCEMAEAQGNEADLSRFTAYAEQLERGIARELWDEDKNRFIAGLAYNEDGWEVIDTDWENIGFDYVWALTLPDDEHLPFSSEKKRRCLRHAYESECWANTVFGAAEVATDLDVARDALVERIVADARRHRVDEDYEYFLPNLIAEAFGNYLAPQTFSIGPSIRALCQNAADRVSPDHGSLASGDERSRGE